MGTELHWPRRSMFVEPAAEGADDQERRFQGPGTYTVPDDMVEQYLDRGWQHPEDADGAAEEAPAAPDGPGTADPELDVATDGDVDGFDPDTFVADSWQSVVSAIESGRADGHLDAVREAEEARDGEPRSSVLEALQERG